MELHENHYTRLLDEARAEAAVASRGRQRVLEQLQREEATFLGALAELGERRQPVQVRLDNGATFTGTVDLLGSDLVGVGGTWLRIGAIQAVRTTGSGASRDHAVVVDLDLEGVLGRLVEDRPRLVLHVLGGEPVRGELLAVGHDVVTVRLDGGDVAYVATTAVRGVRPTS